MTMANSVPGAISSIKPRLGMEEGKWKCFCPHNIKRLLVVVGREEPSRVGESASRSFKGRLCFEWVDRDANVDSGPSNLHTLRNTCEPFAMPNVTEPVPRVGRPAISAQG